MRATLVSIQVGRPHIVSRGNGQEVATGIFKSPVNGRVRMNALNLEGDQQADLINHGGRDKSVYAYPSEHYSFWAGELPGVALPWGAFGENLTVRGLTEQDVCIGDQFQVGTAEVAVTQPRIPCFKLNLKFGRDDMVKRFLGSRRIGFYLRVLRQGELAAGDEIVRTQRDRNHVSIADMMKIYLGDADANGLKQRALRVEYLSDAWREELSDGSAQGR